MMRRKDESREDFILRRREYHRNYMRGYALSSDQRHARVEANQRYLATSDGASKRRTWAREYMRRRLAEDPDFRLLHSLRSRLSAALDGALKAGTTLDLVGCTAKDLWDRLELQFLPGMTRENYGKWEVDHCRPCKDYDLTDQAQQRECFHWTNLQPMWAADNASKGAKLAVTAA